MSVNKTSISLSLSIKASACSRVPAVRIKVSLFLKVLRCEDRNLRLVLDDKNDCHGVAAEVDTRGYPTGRPSVPPAKSWPATEPALADQSYGMHLNVSLGDLLRAELLRYEAQIKAIDILPRGRANAARLAHADGYVDGLLCHNSRFRAAPRPRLVVILRRKLRRGLLRGPLRSGETSIFHAQFNPADECRTMINVSGAFHENYEPLLQQNLPEAAMSKSWSRQRRPRLLEFSGRPSTSKQGEKRWPK